MRKGICLVTRTQGRANWFLIGGGCSPKFGPPSISGPPKKNFSGKQKFFPENIGDGGRGGGGVQLSKFSAIKSVIFLKNCNSTTSGPPPRKLGPLLYFTFLGGGGGTALRVPWFQRFKINLWLKAAIDSSSRANQLELGSDPDSVS